jgi:hypothetical protein
MQRFLQPGLLLAELVQCLQLPGQPGPGLLQRRRHRGVDGLHRLAAEQCGAPGLAVRQFVFDLLQRLGLALLLALREGAGLLPAVGFLCQQLQAGLQRLGLRAGAGPVLRRLPQAGTMALGVGQPLLAPGRSGEGLIELGQHRFERLFEPGQLLLAGLSLLCQLGGLLLELLLAVPRLILARLGGIERESRLFAGAQGFALAGFLFVGVLQGRERLGLALLQPAWNGFGWPSRAFCMERICAPVAL